MAKLSDNTPKKVRQTAINLGAHNDCLISDVDGACMDCIDIMHEALLTHYGHLTFEDRVDAILSDLAGDLDG
jgi:hypothetical protein